VHEGGAAHPTDAADDTTGDPNLLPGLLLEGGENVGGQIGAVKAGRIWIDAGRAEAIQLFETLLEESIIRPIVGLLGPDLAIRRPGIVVCHSIAPSADAARGYPPALHEDFVRVFRKCSSRPAAYQTFVAPL